MMTKKEKLELAQIIAEAVITAMKATPANSGRGASSENETTPEEKIGPKYSTKLKDYEPKKVDGFYKWGRKTDTIKSRNYRAMQIAYCYAVATNGQAVSSDECLKLGIEVDYDGAYAKAKKSFRKKYVYIKKEDR